LVELVRFIVQSGNQFEGKDYYPLPNEEFDRYYSMINEEGLPPSRAVRLNQLMLQHGRPHSIPRLRDYADPFRMLESLERNNYITRFVYHVLKVLVSTAQAHIEQEDVYLANLDDRTGLLRFRRGPHPRYFTSKASSTFRSASTIDRHPFDLFDASRWKPCRLFLLRFEKRQIETNTRNLPELETVDDCRQWWKTSSSEDRHVYELQEVPR